MNFNFNLKLVGMGTDGVVLKLLLMLLIVRSNILSFPKISVGSISSIYVCYRPTFLFLTIKVHKLNTEYSSRWDNVMMLVYMLVYMDVSLTVPCSRERSSLG